MNTVATKYLHQLETETPRQRAGGGGGRTMQMVIDKRHSRKDVSFLFFSLFPQLHSSDAQKTNYVCGAFNVSDSPAGVAVIQLVPPTLCWH